MQNPLIIKVPNKILLIYEKIIWFFIISPMSAIAARDNCPTGDCVSFSTQLDYLLAWLFYIFIGFSTLLAILKRDINKLKFYARILIIIYMPIVGVIGLFLIIGGNYDHGIAALISCFIGYKIMGWLDKN